MNIISLVIYFVIGIGIGAFFFYVLKKHVLGEIWGASIVGIIGSILGGYLIGTVFEWLKKIGYLDAGAAILGALILVWLYALVSPGHHKDRK